MDEDFCINKKVVSPKDNIHTMQGKTRHAHVLTFPAQWKIHVGMPCELSDVSDYVYGTPFSCT